MLKNPLLYSSSILLVEDDLVNLKILQVHLEKAGYINILTARNGKEAVSKIIEETPSLVILDLLMPIMDGYSVLEWIQRNKIYHNIPIIVQTSLDDDIGMQRAWDLGATDLIHKPIKRLELLSRIHLHLNQHSLFQELTKYKNKAEEDIKDALSLQLSLLPSFKNIESIREKYTVFFDYIFKPCRFLSGDLFSTVPINEESFSIWISDFSGKGIKAALNTFRIHTLINSIDLENLTASQILESVNSKLINLLPVGTFTTFLYGIVNVKDKTFTYSSASQPPPILYNKTNKTFKFFESQGLPLGIKNNVRYDEHTILLKENESIILYSDALLETEEFVGFSFEEDKFSDFLTQSKGERVIDRIKLIFDAFEGYDFSVSDDLTLIEFSFI